MKNFLVILMIVSSSFVPFVAFAQANFVRDLFVGISGSDVLDLQKILNSDSETQISDSGVGSPGNETTYFGNLTKLAVQKFQIKYSDYVLKPIGLAVPIGYVGALTIDFLNKTFVGNVSSENNTAIKNDVLQTTQTSVKTNITNTTTDTTTLNLGQQLVTLKSLSQENVLVGQTFEINGAGFLKTSEVYLSCGGKEIKIDGTEYVDSTKLKVTISNSSKVKNGIYLVYVQNALENDTRWNSPLFILVSNKKIEGISDKKIKDAFDLMKENNNKLINKIDENSKIVSVENMINIVNEAEDQNGQKGFVGLAVSVGNVLKDLVFNEVLAQSSGGGSSQKTYWGGHISKVTYCTCYYSFGIILKIKEKSSSNSSGAGGAGGSTGGGAGGASGGSSAGGSQDLKVVYQILISTLRANYNIFKAGANTIGGWTQTSFTCEDTSGYSCTSSSSETDSIDKRIDFLRGIGTSGANSDDYQGGGQ